MTDTAITPVTSDPDLEDEDPIFSHIVGPTYSDDNPPVKVSGAERVMVARVEGTPVEALCGYVWVPSRDPERHPVCERCLAIAKGNPDA